MTPTEILTALMNRIDRLTTAVERIADAMEHQSDQASRISELEALLEQSAPQTARAALKAKTGEKQAYKGQTASPDDTVQEKISSRNPTGVELTRIDTIILSMDGGGRTETTIAKQLNAEGLSCPQGGKWTEGAVRTRLTILKG